MVTGLCRFIGGTMRTVCSGASILQAAFRIVVSEFLLRCSLKEEGLGSRFEGRDHQGWKA